MLRLSKNKKGQVIAEYALLFAAVLGAYIGMQHYIKQRLQARIADAIDFTKVAAQGQLTVNGNAFAFTRDTYEPDQSGYKDSKRTSKEETGQLDGGTILNGKDSVSQTWQTTDNVANPVGGGGGGVVRPKK